MEEILNAIGSFSTLAAESVSAAEARRAQILAEADAAYRTYRDSLVGLFAGLRADDAEMAALAKPIAPPAAPAPPPPVSPTPAAPPSPRPSGTE